MKEYYVTIDEFRDLPSKDIDGKYIFDDHAIYYMSNGLNHRLDGHAIEHPNGYKAWYINGRRHRLDGPAIEYSSEHIEYWVNNERYYSKEEYEIAAYLYKNNLEIYS